MFMLNVIANNSAKNYSPEFLETIFLFFIRVMTMDLYAYSLAAANMYPLHQTLVVPTNMNFLTGRRSVARLKERHANLCRKKTYKCLDLQYLQLIK